MLKKDTWIFASDGCLGFYGIFTADYSTWIMSVWRFSVFAHSSAEIIFQSVNSGERELPTVNCESVVYFWVTTVHYANIQDFWSVTIRFSHIPIEQFETFEYLSSAIIQIYNEGTVCVSVAVSVCCDVVTLQQHKPQTDETAKQVLINPLTPTVVIWVEL